MEKAYLLVYSKTLGSRESIRDYLDNLRIISNWKYDLPNAFYIISNATADEISNEIRKKSKDGRFIITEINDNRQGYLPEDTWELISNKSIYIAK